MSYPLGSDIGCPMLGIRHTVIRDSGFGILESGFGKSDKFLRGLPDFVWRPVNIGRDGVQKILMVRQIPA